MALLAKRHSLQQHPPPTRQLTTPTPTTGLPLNRQRPRSPRSATSAPTAAQTTEVDIGSLPGALHAQCLGQGPPVPSPDGGGGHPDDLRPGRPLSRPSTAGGSGRDPSSTVPDVAAKLEDAGEDLIAFSAFPSPHWTKPWSTNPLERVNAEIKRRTNVVGIFPNDASILRLVSAVLVEQHDEWAVAERRYLSEESMTLLEVMTDELDDKEVPLAITA
jgi:hypothetical protein